MKLIQLVRKVGIIAIPDLYEGLAVNGPTEWKLPITGYCQVDDYSCGVTAGWSALSLGGSRITLRKFDRICKPHEENGTTAANLIKALRTGGCRISKIAHLHWVDVQREIRAGRPVICVLSTKKGHWHWVTIYGFRIKPSRVFYVGRVFPLRSKSAQSWTAFRKRIRDFAIVCRPTGPWSGNHSSGKTPRRASSRKRSRRRTKR
jgi:hypothetical protein